MSHLTKEQRYVISSLRKRGISQKEIAEELGVSPSTFTQAVAGEMNKDYLFLHSGLWLVTITKDVVPTDIQMKIVRVSILHCLQFIGMHM